MTEYEEKFTRLSKYAPEMVNTEVKRMRRFQQGLIVEIQDALVIARVETYAEKVEMAQRIEDSKAKVNELQNARRVGPKPWMGRQSRSLSRTAKSPQENVRGQPPKRSGGPSATSPAKRLATNPLCNYCRKGNHMEKDCWKKIGRCLSCGSTEHQI